MILVSCKQAVFQGRLGGLEFWIRTGRFAIRVDNNPDSFEGSVNPLPD